MLTTRLCRRCPEPATTKGYCHGCRAQMARENRARKKAGTTREYHRECALDCSKAPPPPPGFRESDLLTGRPVL